MGRDLGQLLQAGGSRECGVDGTMVLRWHKWAGDGLGESGAREASRTAAELVVEHWLKWWDGKHRTGAHSLTVLVG